MEAIAQFHFIRPGWLLLAPVAIGIWWFWRRSCEPLRAWRRQVDPDLLKAMTVEETRSGDYSAYAVPAAWLLAVVAIAGPTWRQEPNPFAADAAPLMVLLKADESMAPPGMSPSFLERAQLKIADLAKARKGQPLGLIAYAGSAHLVLPPTRDTSIVAEMAANVSPGVMPRPGDRLDLAIRKAGEILAGTQSGGTLLVMADSVQADPQSVRKAHLETGSYPIQFLAMRENASLDSVARAVDASVEPLAPDDQDIASIARAADRKAVVGIAGKSPRWEEAGYWLVPVLTVLVAFSFRREKRARREGAR